MKDVNDLLADFARRLLGTTELRSFAIVGDETDHVVAEVNDRFIIRQRKHPVESGGADLHDEVRLLELVAEVSPFPVPEVIGVDHQAGLMMLRRLAGTSLLDEPCPNPNVLVEQLARFLDCIGGLPIDLAAEVTGRDDYSLKAFLDDSARHLEVAAALLSNDQRKAVESFLGSPPPPEPTSLVFCHNDLGAEHLLASPDRSRITGVIDWSDAAITDPARDLGRLHRDLGSAAVGAILKELTLIMDDHLVARTTFHARCALLEDLAFGITRGRQRYVDAAMDRLNPTFRV